MRKHWGFGFRIICLIILISVVWMELDNVLVAKKYMNSSWPSTTTYKGFYDISKDSCDVIMLGSSHTVTAFDPQIIYDVSGIRSYNLGCELQNLLVSYYWLKEALRYQTPQVVILDTYMLFQYERLEALNSPETSTRLAIDPMRWSRVKLGAVWNICNYDTSQNVKSYFFRNMRYHNRWKELSKDDFLYRNMEKKQGLKGFVHQSCKVGDVGYTPFDVNVEETCGEMNPLMTEYLSKIVSICRNNNIELILVKTPAIRWNIERYNSVRKYADENQIEFIDFNISENYIGCGFDFANDMNDEGHCNIWGASKISKYMAQLIKDRISITQGINDSEWIEPRGFHDFILENCEVQYIEDIDEYFSTINKKGYSVFVAGQDYLGCLGRNEVSGELEKIGLTPPCEDEMSYLAVIEDGNILFEQSSDEAIYYQNRMINCKLVYKLVSNNRYTGKESSIEVNGIEMCRKHEGLNILVYNNEISKVVDTAYYDGELVH